MGLKNKAIPKPLNIDNILSLVSEESIFTYYLGKGFQLGTPFISPLRQELTPSFSIFINSKNNKGRLYFKDFGNGESGDVFYLIQLLFNLNFLEALQRVNKDFNLGLGFNNYNTNTIQKIPENLNRKILEQEKINLTFIPKNFTQRDLNYWIQFGITKENLNKFEVYNAEMVFNENKDKVIAYSTFNNPCYVYKLNNHLKIYQPFHPLIKWISNCTDDDIFGLKQLDLNKNNILIITKSLKDVIVLHNLGFQSIAPQSEQRLSWFTESKINKLKSHYKKIFILFDCDKTGYLSSDKLSKLFECERIFINNLYCIFNKENKEIKDISDYYKFFKFEKSLELINNLVNNEN